MVLRREESTQFGSLESDVSLRYIDAELTRRLLNQPTPSSLHAAALTAPMEDPSARPRRHHGFEKPLHWRQIATVVIMLLLVGAMYYQCTVVLTAEEPSVEHHIVCEPLVFPPVRPLQAGWYIDE